MPSNHGASAYLPTPLNSRRLSLRLVHDGPEELALSVGLINRTNIYDSASGCQRLAGTTWTVAGVTACGASLNGRSAQAIAGPGLLIQPRFWFAPAGSVTSR